MSLELRLEGRGVQKKLAIAKLDGNRLDFTLKLPNLAEGKYTLSVTLKKGDQAQASQTAVLFLADGPGDAGK
jgi:hypothetical protein